MTPSEPFFRLALAGIMIAMLMVSLVFRKRARREKGTLRRSSESFPLILIRVLVASLLYVPIFLYVIRPDLLSWSFLEIPTWIRLFGVGLGLAALPLIYLVFRTIGSNISETIWTKESHALITEGPYQRVRHPLYSVSSLSLLAFSLITTSWFVGAMTLVAVAAILWIVVPKEEEQLIERFGSDYLRYRTVSGRLVPRIRKRI